MRPRAAYAVRTVPVISGSPAAVQVNACQQALYVAQVATMHPREVIVARMAAYVHRDGHVVVHLTVILMAENVAMTEATRCQEGNVATTEAHV